MSTIIKQTLLTNITTALLDMLLCHQSKGKLNPINVMNDMLTGVRKREYFITANQWKSAVTDVSTYQLGL